ncbi:MAG: hypothetical protein N2378_03815, partial [Chloroflexaceae bacterium]|nr:hypothetical protein [Chloroflexaceae bacterium]
MSLPFGTNTVTLKNGTQTLSTAQFVISCADTGEWVAARNRCELIYTAAEGVFGIADENAFRKVTPTGTLPFQNSSTYGPPGYTEGIVPYFNCWVAKKDGAWVIMPTGRVLGNCMGGASPYPRRNLEIDPKNAVIYDASGPVPSGVNWVSVISNCDTSDRCSRAYVPGGFYYTPGLNRFQVRFASDGGGDTLIDTRPNTWALIISTTN